MAVELSRALGPYDLGERLGAGAMGFVYRARHRLLQQPRAVKILQPHLAADERFLQLFHREARVAASLEHPGIVRVFDVGEIEGQHFLAMALLEGRPLHHLIRTEGPLPAERVAVILRQLADTLQFAHERNVLHRDIKPSNVLVDANDRVTLVDFGIARALDGTSTASNVTMGTVGYMAPELFEGRPASRATDGYALAIVAFELLCGRTPFGDLTPQAMGYAHVHKTPPPLRAWRPDQSAAAERIIARALDKDASERYPSVAAFADALVPALEATGRLDTTPMMLSEKAGDSERATTLIGDAGPLTGTPRLGSPSMLSRWRWLLAAGAVVLLAFATVWRPALLGMAPAAIPVPTPIAQIATAPPIPPTAGPAPLVAPTAPVVLTRAPATGQPPTVVPADPTPGPEQRLLSARAALDAGRLDEARATIDDLRSTVPTLPGLAEVVAAVYIRQGEWLALAGRHDEAQAAFDVALQAQPDNVDALDAKKQSILQENWDQMEAAWDRDDEAALAAAGAIFAADPGYRDVRQKLYALLVAKADRQVVGGDRDAAVGLLTYAREVALPGLEAMQRLAGLTPAPGVASGQPSALPAPPHPSVPQTQPQPQPSRAAPAPQPEPTPEPPQVAPTPQPQPADEPVGPQPPDGPPARRPRPTVVPLPTPQPQPTSVPPTLQPQPTPVPPTPQPQPTAVPPTAQPQPTPVPPTPRPPTPQPTKPPAPTVAPPQPTPPPASTPSSTSGGATSQLERASAGRQSRS